MLAIEVEYLLGRAVSTDATRRDAAEWPPHPSRLFSALVDALSDVQTEPERASCEDALRWLESQPPPEIGASLGADVSQRGNVKYFVAVNDDVADWKKARSSPLVDRRSRQERYFPAVVPADPRVYFAWPTSEPTEAQRTALDALSRRVPYLGHSSSLVRVVCRREVPPRTLEPRLAGDILLRVPSRGRLDRLETVHVLRRRDALVQPPKGREVPYALLRGSYRRGPHGDARVLVFDGARFGLEETAWVTQRYRAALLTHLGNAAAVLTGHDADGGRARSTHLAFVPLAHIHGAHADGSIKGLAVVIPRDADDVALTTLDGAMQQVTRLVFGARGEVRLRALPLDDGGDDDRDASVPESLRFSRYARAARTWVSVTPVALGRHPKPRKGLTEVQVLAADLADQGLPELESVGVQSVSFVRAAPPSREYRRGELSALRHRLLRHVVLTFAEPVQGPLLIGAGRYMGFGLLLPAGSS
jgi:CRISPR-associated protein Csb2